MLEYELIQARSQELQAAARHDALVREALESGRSEVPGARLGLLRGLRQRRVRALSPRPQLKHG
ncbi:hypothetical protein ACIRBX_22145 [Kitasatospora sp. NPDC096147]|uniref:hypothetical protein n=1 Tax=Kitasatospora sp. NPDC096147 TaxID=3364093 RepID=UPI00380F1B43